MFNFDKIAQIASAAVCSVILTTVAVGTAIGPGTAGAQPTAVYASADAAETARG